MTDFSPPSQPRPGPDTAGISTHAKPVDALGVLRGRMLVQVNPRRVGSHVEHVYTSRSGLVLSGKKTSEKVAELRKGGYSGVLLADPARYLTGAAQEDEPFLPPDNQTSTFSVLEDELATQLARGADAVMSPTGYIDAEDSGSLKAAAKTIIEFNDPRMIFTVPISVAWLQDSEVPQVIAVLKLVPGIKAIMLGGQMDPLKAKKSVANLCRVLSEVPNTALMRTDIAAFGALAHGAIFSSFGMGSSQRHIVPPFEITNSSKFGGKTPSVLYPDLMGFFLGETIARRFAAHADAPSCSCATCGGKPLDRFTDKSSEKEAIAHNISVMMGWAAELEAAAVRTDPRYWWRDRCATAIDRHLEINTRIKQPKAFEVSAQLDQWSGIPAAAGSPLGAEEI